METSPERRAVLEVAAGVVAAFILASVWEVAATRIVGHRGTDKPLIVSLALSFLAQAVCVVLLWRTRRRVAYGFLGYIGFEILFMLGALTVFHRS